MVAYRFCRTDDIPLLVDGYNRCWRANFPSAPLLDVAGFKRWIRDLQLWTSSCMVAADDNGPFAVLLGCKREDATLIWRIVVHPERQRQGHARHLLTSLSSKLAILGPPTLRVEIPDDRPHLVGFFGASGFSADDNQGVFADWCLEHPPMPVPGVMVVPFSVEDMAANQVFDSKIHRSWQRNLATLRAQSPDISGIALASFDGIDAYLLARTGTPAEIVSFGCVDSQSAGSHFHTLLAAWTQRHGGSVSISRVSDEELPTQHLIDQGFRRATTWREWRATATPA